MGQNYVTVPDILTGKDLDYLCDMFNWNYGALKKCNDYLIRVNNNEIKIIIEEAFSLFNNNINVVLNILREGIYE